MSLYPISWEHVAQKGPLTMKTEIGSRPWRFQVKIGLVALFMLLPLSDSQKENATQSRSTTRPDKHGHASALLQRQTTLPRLPLHFVENRGQFDSQIGYYLQEQENTAYFTAGGVTFVQYQLQREKESVLTRPHLASVALQEPGEQFSTRSWALQLDFINTHKDARPQGQQQTPVRISYFTGPRQQWQTNLLTYHTVLYKNLWPGIDLIYSSQDNQLKHTFIVHPGADPSLIQLAYRGATDLTLTEAGQLVVTTPLGTITNGRPYAYQEQAGEQAAITARYNIHKDKSQYSFAVGDYDRTTSLILVP